MILCQTEGLPEAEEAAERRKRRRRAEVVLDFFFVKNFSFKFFSAQLIIPLHGASSASGSYFFVVQPYWFPRNPLLKFLYGRISRPL